MNNNELNKNYIEFASKISFFEFGTQNEYRPALIDVKKFSSTINRLQANNAWNIDSLSDYITKYPESFKLFEGLFRLERFSNAQLIHFIFDTVKLNSNNTDTVYEYAILNLKCDVILRKKFLDLISKEFGYKIEYENIISNNKTLPKEVIVAYFKMTVNIYAIEVDKEPNYLEKRIKKEQFNDSAIRIANYILNTLQLNEFLKVVKIKDFLNIKQIPADTKSIHGNFLKTKLTNILHNARIENIDDRLKELNITVLPETINELDLKQGQRYYCTEKAIKGVTKSSNNKLKKFDIIIIVNNKPKHLFEINFYTTGGTKIGINENEYVDLNEDIIKEGKYNFHWITDGNYWLSKQGKERYLNLIRKQKFENIYNANMFEESLSKFI